MTALLDQLRGKYQRSIGRSNQVVQQVLRDPHLLAELFEGLKHTDAIIRMRAADALEKISAQHPDWL